VASVTLKQTKKQGEQLMAEENREMEIMIMGIKEEVFDGFPSNSQLLGAYLINAYSQSSRDPIEVKKFMSLKIESALVFVYTQEQNQDVVVIVTRGEDDQKIPYLLKRALQKAVKESPKAVISNALYKFPLNSPDAVVCNAL
jgi:hypothetical protein